MEWKVGFYNAPLNGSPDGTIKYTPVKLGWHGGVTFVKTPRTAMSHAVSSLVYFIFPCKSSTFLVNTFSIAKDSSN